jgi:hypothetical protein
VRALASFAFVLAIAACGGGTGPGDDGDDGNDPPDANPNGDLPPPAMGFQLVSADIELAPYEETTKCWYFQTPNEAELAVQRWESQMTPGSHHLIVYFTSTQIAAPGTVVEDCNVGLGAVWMYASQSPYYETAMPVDPEITPAEVGMRVAAGQYGFFQMHYLNASDQPLTAHATLNAHTFAPGTPYTPTAPYITFQDQIAIPPLSTATFGGNCNVPAGRKFFQLGTHAHKQATHTEVRDGATVVFESDDWAHPGVVEWTTAPFHTFSSNTLTYECDFYNPDPNRTVYTGDSAATEEMCMAVGYMFPASSPQYCLNSATF